MKIEIVTVIYAPPKRVWYWLGDPERASTWMTSVTHTEYIERTPDLIGSTFREYVEEEGQGTWMHGQIIDYVSEQRMAFHLEGDYNVVDVVFTLAEINGTTRLIQTVDMRFKGLLRATSLVFGRAIRKNIVKQAESEFAALKDLCESDDEG